MNQATASAQNQPLRQRIRQRYLQSEPAIVKELLAEISLSPRERHMLSERAAEIVATLRAQNNPTIMESFLGEYGLSTREGVGLMCLAEALLRVPDSDTIDELIADKIEPSNWGMHLGQSSSSLVNASTWALLLTGRILDDGTDDAESTNPVLALRQLIRRLGEPVVRTAVSQAMKMLGKQFVLGQTINEAISEASALEAINYTYSYDMLGEAARTHNDAERYFTAYANAIEHIGKVKGDSIAERPGISVKLSALHPRYEYSHFDAVMDELLPRMQKLVSMAAAANIGLNIDAEEADRLDLSLDIIAALLDDEATQTWQGFGVVVQAYSRRALPVLDWLFEQCKSKNRRIMVRLVKGAYWDAEIKQAQELGLANFPVFTRKAHTDVSYLVCAQRLLDNRDIVYPQFATHNAHTVSAIRYLAGADTTSFEFQRLHGMGEALHEHVLQKHGTRCRIYAPVGAHVDLLAYLVRRLLENGANSSFVNQIVNADLEPSEVARCPVDETVSFADTEHPSISKPADLFGPARRNSKGFRINDPASIQPLLDAREHFLTHSWAASPLLHSDSANKADRRHLFNPAQANDIVGTVSDATAEQVNVAVDSAVDAAPDWALVPVAKRNHCLLTAANVYEDHMPELCALLCREAGKHLADAIAEVREAVDFLRYYAVQAQALPESATARGVIVCISPWNFPLAIFTGQIAAALATGNAVLAKPAEQAPLIAARAVALLHEAGIPNNILQLLPGPGETTGSALVNDHRIAGVCFTGSTAVAKLINATLANRSPNTVSNTIDHDPMLIAETGGLNAMIVDTTALPEQVVRDAVESAFQSAGQRCSALRILYVQEEAKERLLTMLCGALDTLTIGDPWYTSTDIGPVIDKEAKNRLANYLAERESKGQLIKKLAAPEHGIFCAPAIVEVNGIEDMHEEMFGPILHVASYKSDQLDTIINNINERGYGLTFGLHTRIDDRVQHIVDRIHAGNLYVNRNQIGAIVGSQPFGGEGLSGTGPKAGGPHYLQRFLKPGYSVIRVNASATEAANNSAAQETTPQAIEEALALLDIAEYRAAPLQEWLLPGPTGESNQLSLHPCGRVLVIADNAAGGEALCNTALQAGCAVLTVCTDPQMNTYDLVTDEQTEVEHIHASFNPEWLRSLSGFDAVAMSASVTSTAKARQALAQRPGRIVSLITHANDITRFCVERHVCIDTTAAGGNATLLASAE